MKGRILSFVLTAMIRIFTAGHQIMKLYEYTQDYLYVLEISEELTQDVLIDTLEAIQEGNRKKSRKYCKACRKFEAS